MPTTDLNGLPPAPPEELIPEHDPGAEVDTEEHDDTGAELGPEDTIEPA
jgi:hypothetical protein